jgi:hypothetical protein
MFHSIVVLFEYVAGLLQFISHKMVIPLRFTDTQSHHAAEQKEKQLQTMRVAFGLDGENVHKKGGL